MNITHPQPGSVGFVSLTRAHFRGMAVVVFSLLALAAYLMIANRRSDDLVIPNEKAVAMAMLSHKFSGPRYFQLPPGELHPPPEIGEVDTFITVASASAQEQRIVEERHLSPESAAKLHRLIDKLTEPPPSRLFSERINLVRLNLAMDELK